MRILGIDPGLQTTGFSSGPALKRLHIRIADVSLRRTPISANNP
jgi:Holliday junction resolvasome RuvABC endonuclease subunit